MPRMDAVDYSWGRPNVAELKRLGIKVVMRYLCRSDNGKRLKAPEARALQAAGIDIVSNYEETAARMLDGRSAGVSDAKVALQQHKDAGGPPTAPIYWSIDFDASSSQLDKCWQYLEGVASVTGWDRIGVYGGYKSIDYVHKKGKVKLLWSTYAWSSGKVHPATNLYQWQNNVTVAGALVDKNEMRTPYVGQWGASPPASAVSGEPLLGLQLKDSGERVKGLQYILKHCGHPVTITGVYDYDTARAVLRVRKDRGSSAKDGYKITGAALEQIMVSLIKNLS